MKTLRAALSLLAGTAALLLGGAQAQAATSTMPSVSPCWTTEQPFTLVENEFAKLTWDVYGNLTLSNHSGKGSKLVWGLNSPVPLTGSNAGKMCFGNGAGRLRIHRSNGEMVWNSASTPENPSTYTYSAPNAVLHLTECTLQIKDTSGVVQWEEQTGQCETRKRSTPAVTRCWSKNETKSILTNQDTGQELLWQDGRLWHRDTKGETTALSIDRLMVFPSNPIAYRYPVELCHQANGELVVYGENNAVWWTSSSATTLPGTSMELDECGLSFSSQKTPPHQSQSHDLIHKRTEFPGCKRPSSIKQGVCMDVSSVGTILEGGNTRLALDANLGLKMLDNKNKLLWSALPSLLIPSPIKTKYVCFQHDGNLVAYRDNWAPLWASDSYQPDDQFTLVLKDNNLAIKNAKVDTECQAFHEGQIKNCEEQICNITQFQKWVRIKTKCENNPDALSIQWQVTGTETAKTLPGGGFSFVKSSRSGNSDFGASIWLVAGAMNPQGLTTFKSRVEGTGAKDEVFAALPSSTPPSNYLEAIADAGVNVTLFGETENLVEALASVENNDGPKDTVKVMVLGMTAYEKANENVFDIKFSEEFFHLQQQYFIGGMPLTVRVGVEGSAGAKGNLDYNWNNGEVKCTITPYAGIDANASIGIGISGFSVGVEGDLQLVQVSFPVTEKLNTQARTYESAVDFDVSTLEGSLALYAEAFGYKAKKNIASFEGFSTSTNLFSVDGPLLSGEESLTPRPPLLYGEGEEQGPQAIEMRPLSSPPLSSTPLPSPLLSSPPPSPYRRGGLGGEADRPAPRTSSTRMFNRTGALSS